MLFNHRTAKYKPVVYSGSHWRMLSELRREAYHMLKCLEKRGIGGIVIGSVARGDVHEKSDIDVFTNSLTSYFIVEDAVLDCGYRIDYVRVVKATPESGIRLVYSLGARRFVNIQVTLEKLEEEEFHRYAGYVTLEDIKKGVRRAGINKSLVLIVPTKYGHEEYGIEGMEREVARLLGISLSTIRERIRARKKRYSKGRSGLFIDIKARPEDVALILNQIME